MPFVLSGVLIGPDGWPAPGAHAYRVTQHPDEILSNSERVHRGTVKCDELGFFMLRLEDFDLDAQRPVALRIGASEDVVRGVARWDLVDSLEGMQLYSMVGHFRRSEVEGETVRGIELGQVQLEDLPLVKEVRLGSEEVSELIFRITPFYPSGSRFLEDWMGREFPVRTDRTLRLYTERPDRRLRFVPDPNSGWVGTHTCEMGGSLVLEVHPPSVVHLTVSPEDHPGGYRWQLVRELNYEERPIESKEGWSWTRLVDLRCGGYSSLSAKPKTLRNRALGRYKLLVWSGEPTPDRLPLRVASFEIVAGEQEVHIR